jgi:hypothetical protein
MNTNKPPRRFPTSDELPALMRCYGYRFTRTGTVAGAERAASSDDVAALTAAGWHIDTFETWSTAEIVQRSVAAADALDEDAVLAAFVAGMGSAPHGRQILISFSWARGLGWALSDAAASSSPGEADLPDCGLDASDGATYDVDVTERLLRLELGWSWNELPYYYLPDLEAAAQAGLPEPTDDDRTRLRSLLEIIEAQPGGTAPGALEKAIAQAKILPGTDKYQRYGILLGLSELGVLPSRVLDPMWDRFISHTERSEAGRAAGGSMRSDITVPLAGWRGGLDADRTKLLTDI